MPKLVEIVGFGTVEFPESMSDDDIAKVLKENPPVGSEQMGYEQNVPSETDPSEPTPAVEQPPPAEPTTRSEIFRRSPIAKAFLERPPKGQRTLGGGFGAVSTALVPVRYPGQSMVEEALDFLSTAPGAVGKAAEISGGMERGVMNSAQFLTSPLGITTMGVSSLPTAVQRGVSGLFGADMALRHLPEVARQAGTQSVVGDAGDIAQSMTELGLTGLFAMGAGKHAISARRPVVRDGEIVPPPLPDNRPLMFDEPWVARQAADLGARESALKSTIRQSQAAQAGAPAMGVASIDPTISRFMPRSMAALDTLINPKKWFQEPFMETPAVEFPPPRPVKADYVPARPLSEPVPEVARPVEVGVVAPEQLRGEFPSARPVATEAAQPTQPTPSFAEAWAQANQVRLKGVQQAMGEMTKDPQAAVKGMAEGGQPTTPPTDFATFADAWGEAQLAAARKRMGRLSINPLGPIDPQLLAGYAAKGAAYLHRRVTNFSIWSGEMLKDLGDDIRPFLKQIYDESVKVYQSTSTDYAKQTEIPGTGKIPLQQSIPPVTPTEGQASARTPPQASQDRGGQTQQEPEVLLTPPAPTLAQPLSQQRFPVPVKHDIQSFGFERIPFIGKLFGERPKATSQQDFAVLRHADELGQGKAVSSAFGEEIHNTIDGAFARDRQGRITNIVPRDPSSSLYVGDVFENLQKDPASYQLSPTQREAFNKSVSYLKELEKLEDATGIYLTDTGEYVSSKTGRQEAYFPRIVIGRPKESVGPSKVIIAGRQFFQKERGYATEKQGAEVGKLTYEPSIEKRLVTRAERLYKAIADKRLKDDPAMNIPPDKVLEDQLKQEFPEMDKNEIKSLRDGWKDSEGVAIQKALNRAFPGVESTFRRRFLDLSNRAKQLKFTADLGVGQIQGLPLLFSKPSIWAEAQWVGLQALFSKSVFPDYVRANLPVIREMAQLGSSVGRFEEFLAGFEQKGPAWERVLLKPLQPFGRQFQSFLDVAKVELYKSYREVTPRNELPAVAQTIESMLQTARMESVGLNRNRTMAERLMLLAPSYYRGALNLVAATGQPGISGKIARRAVGGYMAGGLATFVGVAKLLEMTEEEIIKRLNPANSAFMSWDIDTGDHSVRMGLGGIYHSLLRLMGSAVKTSIEHPENWTKLTSSENPFVRWFRGHAAPAPGLTWDAINGRDFLDNETDVTTIAQSMVPLTAQEALRAVKRPPGEPPPTGLEIATTLFGLRSYPLSVNAERSIAREEVAQKRFKQSYDSLDLQQLVEVSRDTEALPQFARQPSTQRSREMAFEADLERKARVQAGVMLAKPLIDLGLDIPGYEPSLNIQKIDVYLPKDARDELEQYVIEEYNRVLVPKSLEAIKRLPPNQRQDFLSNKLLNPAKERARKRLMARLLKKRG